MNARVLQSESEPCRQPLLCSTMAGIWNHVADNWNSTHWQSGSWQCSVCSSENWANVKKCHKCGVKKNYSDTYWSDWSDAQHSHMSAQPQTEAYAPQVVNACGDESAAPDPSLPRDRDALTAGIKSLSKALAALPETVEFAAQRTTLNS